MALFRGGGLTMRPGQRLHHPISITNIRASTGKTFSKLWSTRIDEKPVGVFFLSFFSNFFFIFNPSFPSPSITRNILRMQITHHHFLTSRSSTLWPTAAEAHMCCEKEVDAVYISCENHQRHRLQPTHTYVLCKAGVRINSTHSRSVRPYIAPPTTTHTLAHNNHIHVHTCTIYTIYNGALRISCAK